MCGKFPHLLLVYCGMGSTRLALQASSKDAVQLLVSGEVEIGEKDPVTYVVPRSVGLQTFNNTSTGLDFAALEAYRKK